MRSMPQANHDRPATTNWMTRIQNDVSRKVKPATRAMTPLLPAAIQATAM